jgi:hypothetical protein
MSGKLLIRSAVLHKTIFVCLMLVPFCSASDHWDYEETHNEVRDFVAGGMVHVRMSVGDLHIIRSDTNQIRVRYTIKSSSESRVKNAHVDIDVHDRDAQIEFHASTSGNTNFDVEIQVPQNTNLEVHEKVGDLTVENIEGDKDLQLDIGDIRVAVGHDAYHLVRASTSIGDVKGGAYGGPSGWLGKTLKYNGDGKYELRAHVLIGDISLEGK